MKDGRFENADELRVWLDRKPPPRAHIAPIQECWCRNMSDADLARIDEELRLRGLETVLYEARTADPSCPKCHGAGHYIEECKTPGWRMVDCECVK